MNDFTKEELRLICTSLKFTSMYGMYLDGAVIVYDKIERMIDNYCEHELNGPIYNLMQSNVRDKAISVKICTKCWKIINVNQ